MKNTKYGKEYVITPEMFTETTALSMATIISAIEDEKEKEKAKNLLMKHTEKQMKQIFFSEKTKEVNDRVGNLIPLSAIALAKVIEKYGNQSKADIDKLAYFTSELFTIVSNS